MVIQILNESSYIISFVHHEPNPQTMKPLRVSPQDFNFEIDEEQLAAEIQAQFLCNWVDQTFSLIDTEELENIYQQQLA
jgi:hypothetical protein